MKKTALFLISLAAKVREDDLLALSNELAYKLLLSFFPFVLFLVSLLGFLNLEGSPFTAHLYEFLPADIADTVNRFITEAAEWRSGSLLSATLLFSVYSASTGFRAIIRGVNKTHNITDDRGWLKITALCAALMMVFTFSLIIMLILWIFSDALLQALAYFFYFPGWVITAARLVSSLLSWAVLVGATAWMYVLAGARNLKIKNILPGAFVTVTLWAVFSRLFGLFITGFSNIPLIYGSIAGVFILIMWLN